MNGTPPALGPFRHPTQLLAHAGRNPSVRTSGLAMAVLCQITDAGASTGRCYRSIRRMASELDSDPKAVRKALALLEDHGYLIRQPGEATRIGEFFLPLDRGNRTAPNWGSPDPQPKRSKRAPTGGLQAEHWGSPDPPTGGLQTPPVTCKNQRREPGNTDHVSPSRLLTDHGGEPEATPPAPAPSQAPVPTLPPADADVLTTRARNAIISALSVPDQQSVTLAADLSARRLDGSTAYMGGIRKALWDCSKANPNKHPEILAAFDEAVKLSRGGGKRFLGEVRKIVPRCGTAPNQSQSSSAPRPPDRGASPTNLIGRYADHGTPSPVNVFKAPDRGAAEAADPELAARNKATRERLSKLLQPAAMWASGGQKGPMTLGQAEAMRA